MAPPPSSTARAAVCKSMQVCMHKKRVICTSECVTEGVVHSKVEILVLVFSFYFPTTSPSHTVRLNMLCLSLWCHCERVSWFKSWLTPFQCSIPSVFYVPHQPNEGGSTVFTTRTSCPKAPSYCNKPSHTHFKAPGAFLFRRTHRHDAPHFISIPHSHILTALDPCSNLYTFCQYLVASLLQTCTDTHAFSFSLAHRPKSRALKWHCFSLSHFQSLKLSCH